MLPQSKRYLEKGGYTPQQASYMLIGLFLAGVLGITVLSRVIHNFIPSHVVDCDHTHDEETGKGQYSEAEEHTHHENEGQQHETCKTPDMPDTANTEHTPLLPQTANVNHDYNGPRWTTGDLNRISDSNGFVTAPHSRRPSSNTKRSWSRTLTKYVSTKKEECDEDGPCMGYSDPCGQACFKVIQRRTSMNRSPTWQRASSDFRVVPPVPEEDSNPDSNARLQTPHERDHSIHTSDAHSQNSLVRTRSTTHHYYHPEHEHNHHSQVNSRRQSTHSHNHAAETDHHHHVPTNAFMSIGLQTSLAIALHKAPEGFITYATNHASPSLGFSVFMALFIHNITEGFAMSLPLYLALGSRLKAIVWSAFLGGASQPLGAGVAALWFKLSADSGHLAPDERVYGGMFAVTAGVMTSVALSLFAESLQLSHNKGTCIIFAFLGMALLGVSFALTAK